MVGFHFLPPHRICSWYFRFSPTVYTTLYTILVAVNFFHVPTCLACPSWFRAGPYHASTTIIAQVIIHFKGRRKRKYNMTFVKRVFMFFNVFYISRLLIIDQVSFTWHAQHRRLQMQIESRCLFFPLSFLLLLNLFFFAIYSKASSFLVSLMRLHISLFRHVQFFTLVESMLRNYPHRRLIAMIMSVCNRTK